jgi:hypothetical protein
MKCDRCGKDNPAEVHTCFPLALKLATELMAGDVLQAASPAAAELRRLHADNEALRTALQQLIEVSAHLDACQATVEMARAALTGGKT